MSLYDNLRDLRNKQPLITDGYRLFHDGTIKTVTLTDSLEKAWYVLAKSIPGASHSFRRHFIASSEGLFLKVDGIRDAITLRDRMYEQVVEAKVQRRIEMDTLNSEQAKSSGSSPVLF